MIYNYLINKMFTIFLILTTLSTIANADLTTGTSKTPDELVQSLIGNGVNVTNVNYTGALNAIGNFSGEPEIIGFNEGIILSTGDVGNVIGNNSVNDKTTNNSEAGDTVLTAISGYDTYDASILEFDFKPVSNLVELKYVFGSEEYNEYANTGFNDVFGFFVNGNTVNDNIAKVPGTDIPVAINNINGGNPFGNNSQHSEFYRNNELSYNTIQTELDGLTQVLTAIVLVNPGVYNHIRIGIADGSDEKYDSDVFIKAGSMIAYNPSLTPLNAINHINEIHTVTAHLFDTNGLPVSGAAIHFNITGGPNAGKNATMTTNVAGEANWSYSGSTTGNDVIIATAYGSMNSNTVSKVWIENISNVPEFPTLAFPIAGVLGIMLLMSRWEKK